MFSQYLFVHYSLCYLKNNGKVEIVVTVLKSSEKKVISPIASGTNSQAASLCKTNSTET